MRMHFLFFFFFLSTDEHRYARVCLSVCECCGGKRGVLYLSLWYVYPKSNQNEAWKMATGSHLSLQ